MEFGLKRLDAVSILDVVGVVNSTHSALSVGARDTIYYFDFRKMQPLRCDNDFQEWHRRFRKKYICTLFENKADSDLKKMSVRCNTISL